MDSGRDGLHISSEQIELPSESLANLKHSQLLVVCVSHSQLLEHPLHLTRYGKANVDSTQYWIIALKVPLTQITGVTVEG